VNKSVDKDFTGFTATLLAIAIMALNATSDMAHAIAPMVGAGRDVRWLVGDLLPGLNVTNRVIARMKLAVSP